MAHILVVDDHEDIRAMIQVVLEEAGHRVNAVPGGEQAVRSIRRKAPDVVLLDLMMPGMDGFAVLDRIRSMPSRKDVPVIVVTAKHDPRSLTRELEHGAVDHLAKPFLPSELEAAVERVLGEGGDASQHRRRILSADADIYTSVGDLVSLARAEI